MQRLDNIKHNLDRLIMRSYLTTADSWKDVFDCLIASEKLAKFV